MESGIAILATAGRCRKRSECSAERSSAGRRAAALLASASSRSFGAVRSEDQTAVLVSVHHPSRATPKKAAPTYGGKRRFRRRSVELRGASRVHAHLAPRPRYFKLEPTRSPAPHSERAIVAVPCPLLSLLNHARRPLRPWRRCSLLRPVRHPCRSALLSTRADRTHTRRPVCARTATAIQLEEPTRLADPVARPFSRARSSSTAGTSHLVVRLGRPGRRGTELELDKL